jgi:hypothetical protein
VPLINVTLQHGRTLDEAKVRLEQAVQRLSGQFGAFVRHVEWSAARDRVKLDGAGFWVELSVDGTAVHAVGDIVALAGLLGGQLPAGVRRILEQAFMKRLP